MSTLHRVKGYDAPVVNRNCLHLSGERTDLPTEEAFLSQSGVDSVNFPNNDGELIHVVSTSASDTGTITLYGLDSEFKTIDETLVMTGITPVSTTKLFSRINGLSYHDDPGFLGTIDVTDTTDAVIYRRATAAAQRLVDAVITIPAGEKWQVLDVLCAQFKDSNAQSACNFSLYFGAPNRLAARELTISTNSNGSSSLYYENILPEENIGPFDIFITAEASDSGLSANVRMTIGIDL